MNNKRSLFLNAQSALNFKDHITLAVIFVEYDDDIDNINKFIKLINISEDIKNNINKSYNMR